ncbi:hypothetical protein CBX98_25655, partial [Vibrio sp. T9]
MPQPGAAQTLLFGKLDTTANDDDLRHAYTAIVDRYGQYTRSTWPEKIDSDDALKQRANALPTMADVKGLDQYGGRTDLPALQKTGWFHPQKQ